MLNETFLHLPGMGPVTERKLRARGICCWEDLLAARAGGRLSGLRARRWCEEAEESARRWRLEDWSYFEERLPAGQKWRAFGTLGDRCLFVDIETTGLGGGDAITVIGTCDGRNYRAYVDGRDLEEAAAAIARYPLVVTFNGAQFDLPMIRAHFPGHVFNHIHVDLRFPLRTIGLTGGLKAIERAVGLARGPATAGLDGWDAVRLWYEYRRGHAQALDLLLQYNEEDVRHLQPLMRRVYDTLSGAQRPSGIGACAGLLENGRIP